MPLHIQDLVHKLEEGPWARYVKWIVAAAGTLAVALLYDGLAYRSFTNAEAMDAAQLARNISEGRGYTTYLIRPFSAYLLRQSQPNTRLDLRNPQPDISNPPVYPYLLAGLMKVAPMHYTIAGATFHRFWPEVVITAANQLIFLATLFLVFTLARKLFDAAVAWVSVMVLLGSALLWQFTVSGLSTILLMFIFVSLAWCLVLLEQAGRDQPTPKWWRIPFAALTGLLVGLGALTQYSFGWLLLPVLFFLAVFCGKGRVHLCLAALAAFLVLLTPWMLRNYALTRTPFGTATYSIVAATRHFPADSLERSLKPDLSRTSLTDFLRKFATNIKPIVQSELPKLGGSWVSAFFLVGLIVPLNNVIRGRFRFFILSCLLVLIPVEAFGRTHLSSDVPDVNSENLLVLLAPLIFVYGVSLYFVLLEQITVNFPQMRYAVTALFVAVASLPLMLALIPPRPPTHAYPPYWPPIIQDMASWMKGSEMMMSDIPCGIAWYGHRPCVWLTAKYEKEFYELNDQLSPISAFYVTRRTTDKAFYAEWIKGGEDTWETDTWERKFLYQMLLLREIPGKFPLKFAPGKMWPEQLYVTDSPLRYVPKTAAIK